MKTPEIRQQHLSGVFIVDFEQISQLINRIYYNIIYFTACSCVSIINLLLITFAYHLQKECFNREAVTFCIQKNTFPYPLDAKVDIYLEKQQY